MIPTKEHVRINLSSLALSSELPSESLGFFYGQQKTKEIIRMT